MLFKARVMRADGSIAVVEIAGTDRAAVAARAAADGLEVLSVGRGGLAARGGRFALLQFAQELRALLDSGVVLLEALETLAEKETRPLARQVCQRLVASVGEGRRFSAALEAQPEAFPALFVATVRASERTGDLATALGRFADYRQQQDLVRSRLVGAAVYPVLLLAVGFTVILFLLGYVVPRFARVYADVGGDLPAVSRGLLFAGQFFEAHLAVVLAALAALAVGAVVAARSEVAARIAGAALWKSRVVAERLLAYQMARYLRTTGMLVRGGTPVVAALEMAGGLLQVHLRPRLAAAIARVREGLPLSAALDQQGLSTPVAARMLKVGEKSGELGAMMERIAAFHDAEIERLAEWVTRLVSPLLMLAMGLVIGTVVVFMYLPIFQLAEQVG